MNKLFKLLIIMLLPVALAVLMVSCEDPEEKLSGSNPTGNAVDVSNRITGFSSAVTGAGAALSVQGNNLSGVQLVNMGGIWVDDVEVTGSTVSFNVPINISLGMQDVVLVFAGSERASSEIEVIALPAIAYFTPKAVGDGDEITILGNNLSSVSSVNIGGADGTINSAEDGMLKFTVPNGVTADVINLVSITGSVVSSVEPVISCAADPDHLACLPVINTNGSFEDATLGEASGVNGWGGLTGTLATGEITDEDAYDGFQSVKITINDIGANPWNIQPTSNMAVDPTKTYHVSMWVKGSGIANVMLAVDEGGTPGWTNWQNPQMAISTNEWTEVSYTFSPTSEALSNGGDETARFAISLSYAGNVGGVFYIDNLRVVEVE